jgi:DNA-binding CsgD family transcriptional regulator
MAYSAAAASCMMADDLPGTRHWGERALELAERLEDLETMAHALNNIGSAELGAGNQQGRELLERSLEISRRLGSDDHVARALNNLCGNMMRLRSYALAERYVDEGLAFAEERGNELKRDVLLVNRAELRLRQGRLSAALADAEAVTAAHSGEELVRLMARVLVAVAGVRRGAEGARTALEELRPSVVRLAEADPLVLVALGLAEAAWLEGDGDTVGAVTQDALARAERSGLSWEIGELACWRRRAGIAEEPPAGIADPCALELAGEHERAAERWTEIGCPFEAAMALAGADDDTAQRRALDMLQELGATPAAAVVARRLRERGVRGLPRGPRPSTRSNPSNLTSRELEVLQLLAEGLPNAGIADRLVLSRRTVDHHVSAILRKLGVGTRGQAAAEAVRLGLVVLD